MEQAGEIISQAWQIFNFAICIVGGAIAAVMLAIVFIAKLVDAICEAPMFWLWMLSAFGICFVVASYLNGAWLMLALGISVACVAPGVTIYRRRRLTQRCVS